MHLNKILQPIANRPGLVQDHYLGILHTGLERDNNLPIQVYYVKGDPPGVSAMSGYSLALFTAIAASVVVVAFTAYLFLRKKKGA